MEWNRMRKGPRAGDQLRAILGFSKETEPIDVCVCVCVCVRTCVWRVGQQARDSEKSWCYSLNPNTVWRQSSFLLGHLSLLSLQTFNWFYEVHWHYGSYSVYQIILIDSDCSHEIKKSMILGRKAMTNLDCRLKSRDITLPTEVHLVKAMVFSNSHAWIWELDQKES